MYRRQYRPLLCGAVVAAAGLSVLTACSSGKDSPPHPSATQVSSVQAAQLPPAVPNAAIGVSPDGITTRVDVPAESTELEYYHACHQAKVWMDGHQGDPESLVEPYLATVQESGPGGVHIWDISWAELTRARQAAVIVAVHAAANDECG